MPVHFLFKFLEKAKEVTEDSELEPVLATWIPTAWVTGSAANPLSLVALYRIVCPRILATPAADLRPEP